MSAQDELMKAIESISTPNYRTSKEEIVSYYQDKYPGTGQNGWRQNLIRDTLATKGITRQSVGDKEYNRLAKNTGRRFDPSRLHTPEKRSSGDYKKLGEQLPPISRTPKKNSADFVVKGEQGNGKGGTRSRTIRGTMSGPTLYDFVNNPSWSDYWDAIGYQYEFDVDEDTDYALNDVSVSAS